MKVVLYNTKTMKVCTKCNKQKPLADFYFTKKTWPMRICKECARPKERERKRKNYNPEKEKVKQMKRQLSGKKQESNQRMYKKYPEKQKARAKLARAIRLGKIIKPDKCDSTLVNECRGIVEAHHYLGYEGEHWKDVIWLCKVHHMFLHRKSFPEKEEE